MVQVGCKWTYIALFQHLHGTRDTPGRFTMAHTHIHQWAAAAMQGAFRPIGSNIGLSVLPKGAGWTIGARFRSAKPSVIRQPALPTLLSQSCRHEIAEAQHRVSGTSTGAAGLAAITEGRFHLQAGRHQRPRFASLDLHAVRSPLVVRAPPPSST